MESQIDIESLTKREREILAMIGRGLSLPEIAERLFRSQKTIESHRLSIGRKLRVSNRVALARIAIQAGLAPLEVSPQARVAREQAVDDRNALWDQVTTKARTWEAVEAIDHALAGVTRSTFLRCLVLAMSTHTAFRYAWVCRVRAGPIAPEPPPLEPIAMGEAGELLDPPPTTPKPGPCDLTLDRGAFQTDDNLGQQFPQLQALGLRAYRGFRLTTTDGQHIGVIALLHDQPVDPEDEGFVEPEPILRLLAPRIAAELDAVRMEERLRELSESLEQQVHERTTQLAEREKQYRSLLETMSEGLLVLDQDNQVEMCNQRACELLGRSKDQIIGQPIIGFYTREGREHFRQHTRARESGVLGRFRRDLVRPDGSTLQVTISPRARFDTQGRYRGTFGIVTEFPTPPPPGPPPPSYTQDPDAPSA